MKRLIIASLVIGIALFGLQAQASANLLTNEGFDSVSSSPWGSWGSGSAGSVIGSTDAYRSPSKSGKLMLVSANTNDYATIFQTISANIGDTLYGNGFVKGNLDANSQAYAQFGFWGGDKLTMVKSPVLSGGTFDWLALNQWSAVVPAFVQGNALSRVEYGIVILASGNGANGTAYFDDLSADSQPIPEPASMILLGTGLLGLFGVTRRKS